MKRLYFLAVAIAAGFQFTSFAASSIERGPVPASVGGAPRAVATVTNEAQLRATAEGASNRLAAARAAAKAVKPAGRWELIGGGLTNGAQRDLVVAAVPVSPAIRLVPGGARTEAARLNVRFAADILDASGTVQIHGPRGETLRVRPAFLAYRDTRDPSGRSVRIGEIQNRIGGVVSNGLSVIYTNVFAGDGLRADVRYSVAGPQGNTFHQDIVVSALPEATAVGLAKPDATAAGGEIILEVWSELLSGLPAARKEVQNLALIKDGAMLVRDEVSIDLGSFKIVTGRGFSLGKEDDANEQLPVAKVLYQDSASGRVFLVEQTDLASVQSRLASKGTRSDNRSGSPRTAAVDLRRELPVQSASTSASREPMLLASVHDLPADSVIIDYVLITSVPLPANAEAWFPAGGDANDAVGNNAGTLEGGVTFAPGEVGRGFDFDGSSGYVNVPSAANLEFTGAFTVEAWIRYEGIWNNAASTIVAKGEDAEAAMDWSLVIMPGGYLRPLASIGGNWGYFNCATPLSAGVWHHVAMTHDGSELRGYVNGELDGVATLSGAVQASDDPLRIGAYAPVNGTASKAFFIGQIDEVTVYSRALSGSELLSIYNAGAAGKHNPSSVTPPSGIVAWWPGDDTAGDLAGAHDGIWHGGASYASANVSSGFQTTAGSFWYGGTFVEVPDSPELNPINAITLEAWIYITGYGNGHRQIISKDAEYGVRQYMLSVTSGNKFRAHVWAPNGGITYFDGNISVLQNTWYHVAMAYDRSNLILYVNGSEDSRLAATHTIRVGTQPVRIGATAPYPDGPPYCFEGIIDEATIYNRALTSGEVSALYSAGGAGKFKNDDPDADGLTNLQEYQAGTNPTQADTDQDGLSDGADPNPLSVTVTPALGGVSTPKCPLP